jgi:hypothetical protein
VAVPFWTPEQLLAMYQASAGDPYMRRIVAKQVDQTRKSTRLEDAVRVASFVVASLLAIGFLCFAALLVAKGEVAWGVVFGAVDIGAIIATFIPSRVVGGSSNEPKPLPNQPAPQASEPQLPPGGADPAAP